MRVIVCKIKMTNRQIDVCSFQYQTTIMWLCFGFLFGLLVILYYINFILTFSMLYFL